MPEDGVGSRDGLMIRDWLIGGGVDRSTSVALPRSFARGALIAGPALPAAEHRRGAHLQRGAALRRGLDRAEAPRVARCSRRSSLRAAGPAAPVTARSRRAARCRAGKFTEWSQVPRRDGQSAPARPAVRPPPAGSSLDPARARPGGCRGAAAPHARGAPRRASPARRRHRRGPAIVVERDHRQVGGRGRGGLARADVLRLDAHAHLHRGLPRRVDGRLSVSRCRHTPGAGTSCVHRHRSRRDSPSAGPGNASDLVAEIHDHPAVNVRAVLATGRIRIQRLARSESRIGGLGGRRRVV